MTCILVFLGGWFVGVVIGMTSVVTFLVLCALVTGRLPTGRL